MRPLIVSLLSLLPLAVSAAPSTRPGAPLVSGENGSEPYTPTRCEYLALELNSNFRETNPSKGFTSQYFCRAPGTIFLSFKYLDDKGKDAATKADDAVREAIGSVMRTRKWTWVKIEDEIVRDPAAPAPVEPKPAIAKKTTDEDEPAEESAPVESTELPETPSEAQPAPVAAPAPVPAAAPIVKKESAPKPVPTTLDPTPMDPPAP